MRHIKECIHCGEEFSLHCPKKRRAGGKINECPDCVEELGLEICQRVKRNCGIDLRWEIKRIGQTKKINEELAK